MAVVFVENDCGADYKRDGDCHDDNTEDCEQDLVPFLQGVEFLPTHALHARARNRPDQKDQLEGRARLGSPHQLDAPLGHE